MKLAGPALLFALAFGACKFAELPSVDPDEQDASSDGVAIDAPACAANTTTCFGATLVVCDDSGNATVTPCGFGCATAGDRCLDLAASNDLSGFLDQARTAAPLVLTGNAIIDTSAGTVRNGDGVLINVQSLPVVRAPVDVFVISVASLDAANISVRGSRALAIMVDGDVILRGTLSVSAAQAEAGAGAPDRFQSFCTAQGATQGSTGTGGGGGGGHGTAGGRGGDGGSGIGGAAGIANGDLSNVPLRGGCPGAFAYGTPLVDPLAARPGAGGGAVQVSARGLIRVDSGAAIAANGGGAKGWTGATQLCTMTSPPSCNQGSGAGAGGAILLESSRIEAAGTSSLVANGGAGHCGYAGQAPDGAVGEVVAPGTECTGGIGNGGDGAYGTLAGGTATSGTSAGGGGGGGVGRIRINVPAGVIFDPAPPTISPAPSIGTTATR